MIKLRCSNEACKYTWFDENGSLCPRCSAKAKLLAKKEKRMEEVIKRKKPHLR